MTELGGQYKPAPILPSQNQRSTHHVSFNNDVNPGYRSLRIIDERDTNHQHTLPWFFKFWAWTCLVLCILCFTFLIVGASFYAMVRSGLPDVYLRKVDFPIVNVDKSNQNILSAAADVVLEIDNGNSNSDIIFGSMKVDVYGEQVKLGQADIPGFLVGSNNFTILTINSTITMDQAAGGQRAAADIESSVKNKTVVIDVFLYGQIGFDASGFRIKGLPLEILCEDINQSDLERGQEPKCSVKILAFGLVFD